MFNVPLIDSVEQKFNWLRELMPWSMLCGELMHICDVNFGSCNFAKPFDEQDPELSHFQYWASIEKLYDQEYAHQLVENLLKDCLIPKE